MKDSYIYYPNGKVIISDDNESKDKRVYKEDEKISDNTVMRDYQDNIEEILVTENMIEELDSRYINTLEKIEKATTESPSKKDIIKMFFSCNGFALSGSLLALLAMGISFLPAVICIMIMINLSLLFVGISTKHCIKKDLNANQVLLSKILEELKEQESKLSELKNNKTKNNEGQMKKSIYKKVDYIKQLEELKEKLVLYYNIGYDEKKLERYYNNDVLEDKLNGEYAEEEIKDIKTYFKKKKN